LGKLKMILAIKMEKKTNFETMVFLKRRMLYILLCSISICTLISCGNGSNSEFEYIELDDCNFNMNTLAESSPVQIISFSGGRLCDNSTAIYFQFIVLDSTSKDTFRVLCPCQNYTFDENNLKASFSSLASLEKISKDFGIAADKKKLVVFNREQEFLEKHDYKTVIGFLSFLPKK